MLLLIGLAQAASLDQLEVGGPWASPTDTGGSAIWWGPGALAGQDGTRFHVEAAPVLAEMRFDRAEPNAGSDVYTTAGVIPHLSVASDLGRERIGPGKLAVGAGLVVPIARGSASEVDNGVGRYAMVDGQSQAIYGMAGVAYRPLEWLSVGLVGGAVRSTWRAISDKDTMPSLADSIRQAGGSPTYTDADLEDPDYGVRADFDLADWAFTGGAGVWLRPHEVLTISASYLHGATVDNRGPVRMDFQCPPQSDTVGRFAAEANGICDSRVSGDATVSYRLPARVNLGAALQRNEKLRLELLGGWVRWSEYEDFEIKIRDPVSETGQLSESTVRSIEQTTWQARDNDNAVWGGLDVKLRPVRYVTVGGRVLLDSGAVPDHALSPNNYDSTVWMISGLLAGHLMDERLTLGASYTGFLAQERSTTESGFWMSLESPPEEGRWEYPHRAGTYGSDIHRVGLHLRTRL
jgi:long-subunit fatty acid transport protein